jgi:hypothetical protein
MTMQINHISVKPSTIARLLGLVAILLVLVSTAGQVSRFLLRHNSSKEPVRQLDVSEERNTPTGPLLGHNILKELFRLFDVSGERNIPTFFSVLLMIFASLLLAGIATLRFKNESRDRFKWIALSLAFMYMAFDEAFQVHEMLTAPTRSLVNSGRGIFFYAWVIPGIAVVVIFALYLLTFWLRLPRKPRFTFFLAAALYLGGAIGVEIIGGVYADLYGTKNLAYHMISATEESLEMAGLIVFIYALLIYIADTFVEVRFRFDATA